MPRVLLIPHGTDASLKTRGHQLAVALAKRPGVAAYYVEYQQLSADASFAERIRFLLRELARPIDVRQDDDGVYRVRVPNLYLGFRPYTMPLIRAVARRAVARAIQAVRPSVVVNGSYATTQVVRSPAYRLVYDLVDDHLPGTHPGWFGRMIGQFADAQLRSADEIWTISRSLVAKLRQRGYGRARYVPNGVDRGAIQAVASTDVAQLRHELGLTEAFVVGYIGNHAFWSGLDFLAEVARRAPASWRFVVIGGGSEVERVRADAPRNMLFLGPVPASSVNRYYRLLDVGVLPFVRTPYTDNALPLKVLEYGAARHPVVAEPLKELRILNLPYVRFPARRSVEAWVATLRACRRSRWSSGWEPAVAAFDWTTIVNELPLG